MASVTSRINQIKQPTGGYLKPSSFKKTIQPNLKDLYDESLENVSASLVGTAVDYMSRFMLTKDAKEAFSISEKGARVVGESKKFDSLLKHITNLDNESIRSALKMVGYDVVFRAGPLHFKSIDEIEPNEETIQNVKMMVERSLQFFNEYGPVVLDGFTFEGGYTDTVNSGDGDFLTKNTLWDFKVSKNEPTNKHTLQLLMYYIMGKHSKHKEFESITNIGIFNPRLGTIYTYDMKEFPKELIKDIEDNVIVYSHAESKKETKKSVSKVTSTILMEKIKRDHDRAENYMIHFYEDSFEVIEDLKKVKQNDLRAMLAIADAYHNVSMDVETAKDYQLQTALYLESVILAEKARSIDEEKGTYLLAKILFQYPVFKLPNGSVDKELKYQIIMTATLYNAICWDEYFLIDCGARAALLMSLESSPLYNPKKTKEILVELEDCDDDDLPDEYFQVMGAQLIKGVMFPYNYQKVKRMYQVLYDRGDKHAFETMDKIMKAAHRASSSNASSPNTSTPSSGTKKGGCYIATCVYGSYDCPEVWVLRRFRDFKLSKTVFGRIFIHLYYFASPKLVRLFGKTAWFKKLWKSKLDKMVQKYKSLGYSDMPYYD